MLNLISKRIGEARERPTREYPVKTFEPETDATGCILKFECLASV